MIYVLAFLIGSLLSWKAWRDLIDDIRWYGL